MRQVNAYYSTSGHEFPNVVGTSVLLPSLWGESEHSMQLGIINPSTASGLHTSTWLLRQAVSSVTEVILISWILQLPRRGPHQDFTMGLPGNPSFLKMDLILAFQILMYPWYVPKISFLSPWPTGVPHDALRKLHCVFQVLQHWVWAIQREFPFVFCSSDIYSTSTEEHST